MNNTKNILLIALITATLVMGTSVIPMQSYAGENKNTKDSKSSIKASTEMDKKSSSQKLDQDNFCYRSDDCEQANQGQQIVGKDNEAKGFNDQSKNLQLQAVTPTATPTQPPTQPPTQTPPTCLECVTTALSGLSPTQLGYVVSQLSGAGAVIPTATPAQICGFTSIPAQDLTDFLSIVGVDAATINTLLDCLRAAGVTVTA